MFDLLIRHATIVDGTGNPSYRGDVAVQGDRIAAMGNLAAARAKTTIDATGRVVCPGFLDVHLHSEVEMLAGRHTAGVQMGVTTELIAPDGMSFAPMPRALFADYYRYVNGIYGPVDVDWNCADFADYLARFAGRIRNNIVAQAPHGVIRLAVKGWAQGPASADELSVMRALTRQCMEAGAVGLNTGLAYAPACFDSLRELVALCLVVAEYGGVYSAHMRSYGADIAASLAETVGIAEQTGIPVHISHFGGTPAMYADAEAARRSGIDITWDAYPYMAGCTLLSYGLPLEVWDNGTDGLLRRLADPAERRRLAPAIEAFFPEDSPPYFAFTGLAHNKWMEGQRVREVARRSGKAFSDWYCDLLIEETLAPLLVFPWPNMPQANEERLRNTLTHPLQMVGTDGVYVGSRAHPRGFGSYARMLGVCVREKGWLSLEDAVRRMTSFPAARFGLFDRGLLRAGLAADLVIFDPQTVLDRATYENPRQSPVGIEHVFVNGAAVISNGQLTASRPGRLIKPA